MAAVAHRLRFGVEDQARDRYPTIPFEVSGHRSIEVTISYDTDAAVIDLGCADPERWRGWSGGARSRFVITEQDATPGYEPGPLPDGEWTVVLGIHAVPREGVEVLVTISTPAEGPVESDPPAPPPIDNRRGHERRLPALDGLTWFAGDFHSHSLHSDGDQSLQQLAHGAAVSGLDFLAVTEHNTVSHHRHLSAVGDTYDISLLPGQEMTTARGHANAFGDIGWIDFRQPADTWLNEVEARGGIMSVNHPLAGDCSWLHELSRLPPALELWHIEWFLDLTSTAMWALWRTWREDVALLGGSDFHHAHRGWPPGTPTTWVAAVDRSPEAILDGVRARHTAITRSPGPQDPALVRLGDELLAVDADGTVLVDIEGRQRVVHGQRQVFRADTTSGVDAAGLGPYRLESVNRNLLAISA